MNEQVFTKEALSTVMSDGDEGKRAESWVFLPTPGDHYSPTTGSAIMTVINGWVRARAADGGASTVLVSRGTRREHYPDGEVQEVLEGPRLGRYGRVVDTVRGRLGLRRLAAQRWYRGHLDGLSPDFRGKVFVSNAPAVMPSLAERCPHADRWLWLHNDTWRPYGRLEKRRVVASCSTIACCSAFISRLTRDGLPEHLAGRVRTVLNGVDSECFTPGTSPRSADEVDDPTVLFVGRMVPQKGVHTLIEALCHLQKTGMRCPRLRVVGSAGFDASRPLSAYENSLRERAQILGGRVQFVPFVDRSEIVDVFRSASILCVPSVWDEPFGLVAAEGMACGLPTVVSRRGGLPEVVGSAGWTFDPDDPSELAGQLRRLCADAKLRSAVGLACRRRAETMDWASRYAEVTGA